MTTRTTMITAAIAAAALLLLPGCGQPGNTGAAAERPSDDVVADPSLTAWDDLKVGDCIVETDWSGQLDGGGVEVVGCEEEHTDELFAVFIHQLESYPGDEPILGLADDACEDAFEDYVGAAHEDSTLDFSYTAPSEETWAAGDRETLCFLFDSAGDPLTGSAKGSGS